MLKERISPIAKDMPQATWAEIIDKCYGLGVDLSAKYMYVQLARFIMMDRDIVNALIANNIIARRVKYFAKMLKLLIKKFYYIHAL